MQKLTTILDVTGTVVLIVGVGVIAGLGWALLATGAGCLAVSWGISGRPIPRRSS